MVSRIAGIVLWPFLPGASYAEGGFKIALYSMALALFFLYAGEYQFPGGASHFTQYARVLLEGGSLPSLAPRDVGYPLLLLLGGYGLTQSFIGVLALHVILAWSIPMAAYATFGREYRYLGFYTAAVVAFSMTPYLFLKFIHHDLAYIALTVLSVYLLVEYLRNGKVALLYGFLAALIATCLTRPAGNLLFIPLLALAWLLRPVRWKHYLFAAAAFAVVLAAYAVHRDRLLGQTPEGTRPSYFGQQIFYNLYVNSSDYDVLIGPELGPATARLFDKVRQELKKHPLDSPYMQEWYRAHAFPEHARDFWFTQYTGQDERFVSTLFRHPGNDRFEYLCLVERNDRVFRDAALEIVRAYPHYPFQYVLRNLMIFLWNPGVTHGRMGVIHDNFIREHLFFYPAQRLVAEVETENVIEPPGRQELRQSGSEWLRPVLSQVERKWRRVYHTTNQIAISLGAVALIAAVFMGGRFRLIVTVTAVFLLYNAAITSAFVEPNHRYHFFVFPLVVMLAGAGVIALFRAFFYVHEAFPSLGKPTLFRTNAWAVEAAPVQGPVGIVWKKAAGLALCSAAVFAIWAAMTWQATTGS